MSEDYKLQVSLKFGPSLIGLLNIRANTPPELESLLEAMEETIPSKTAALTETLVALSNIQSAFPETRVVGSTPTTNAQTCQHGAMTERWGNQGTADEWHGYFCPLPKGAAGKCKPVYPK